MRIIQILTHSLTGRTGTGSWDILENIWPLRLAQDLQRTTRDHTVEFWGMERGFKQVRNQEKDGVLCRIFPCVPVLPGHHWSFPLLKGLQEQAGAERALLHIHDFFSPLAYAIALRFSHHYLVGTDHFDGSAYLGWAEWRHHRKVSALLGYPFLYLLQALPERLSLPRYDLFFTNSERCRSYLSRFVTAERVIIQPPGIDFEVFKPLGRDWARSQLGLARDRKYILFVGLLTKLKGLDALLRTLPAVLADFPDTHLLLAGDGYYRSPLEALATQMGLRDRLSFLGFLPNSQLPLWYNAADVCVLPSHHESFGVVVVEALACGTPFVGTRVGGIPQICAHFKAGQVIPPRDEAALAHAIIETLASPGDFTPDRENARQYYDRASLARRTLKQYEELSLRGKR